MPLVSDRLYDITMLSLGHQPMGISKALSATRGGTFIGYYLSINSRSMSGIWLGRTAPSDSSAFLYTVRVAARIRIYPPLISANLPLAETPTPLQGEARGRDGGEFLYTAYTVRSNVTNR